MRNTGIRIIALLILLTASTAAAERPLSVSADGRGLIDPHGEPVTLNGDAAWHLFARLTIDEAIEYLDRAQSLGFDALLVSLIVSDGYDGSTKNANGDEPFLADGDFSRPNEPYFDHIDRVVAEALARGFTLLIAPAYLGFSCGDQGWCREMIAAGPERMEDWGRWVGARYLHHDRIIWVHGGDADAAAYDALAVVDAVARGIRSVDRRHLHTAHCARNHAAHECYDRPWLDLNTTYGDCNTTVDLLRAAYRSTPVRPNLYIEGRYEFHERATPGCLRLQAYAAALSGAVGHVFGSEKIWDFPAGWRDGLDSPGYEAMARRQRLLIAHGAMRLTPVTAPSVVAEGGPVSAALGSDRKSLLIYLPSYRTVMVAPASIEAESVAVTWFDPASGETVSEPTLPAVEDREFAPPGDGDWVLILSDAAAENKQIRPDPAEGPTLRLFQPSPNPFHTSCHVGFVGSAGKPIELAVHDATGREIAILFEGVATGKLQKAVWHANRGHGGSFFFRLEADDRSEIRRAVRDD